MGGMMGFPPFVPPIRRKGGEWGESLPRKGEIPIPPIPTPEQGRG